jgi:hypothetical protein
VVSSRLSSAIRLATFQLLCCQTEGGLRGTRERANVGLLFQVHENLYATAWSQTAFDGYVGAGVPSLVSHFYSPPQSLSRSFIPQEKYALLCTCGLRQSRQDTSTVSVGQCADAHPYSVSRSPACTPALAQGPHYTAIRLGQSLLGQRHSDDFPRATMPFQGNSSPSSFRLLVTAFACHHHCDMRSGRINLQKLHVLNSKPLSVLYHGLQTRWGRFPFTSRCSDIILV